MTRGTLASIAVLLTTTGWAIAQAPAPVLPPVPPAVAPDAAGAGAPDPAVPASETPGEAADDSRVWVFAEYLLWWVKKGPNPVPLATTGDINAAIPGAFGQPGTRVVLGSADLNYDSFSGGRLSAGWWFDAEQTLGVEVSGFLLEERPVRQELRSDANGNPGIFRPLFDVAGGFGEDTFTVSFPGQVSGTFALASTSQLWGAEANAVAGVYRENGLRVTARPASAT